MSTELAQYTMAAEALAAETPPRRAPSLPWRDPHTIPREELAVCITDLERACEANPASADLRTCLGMAYAMNFQAYKSLDALEAARKLDPGHFFAQMKLAELHYRLRALPLAERETLAALALARTPWEAALSRRQLQEIRRLMREGTQKPEWTKTLVVPSIVLAGMFVLVWLVTLWR